MGQLIKAGILLYKNWDKIKAAAGKLWSTLKKKVVDAVSNAVKSFHDMKDAGKNLISGIKDGILTAASGIGDWFKDNVLGLIQAAMDGIEAFRVTIAAKWNDTKESLKSKWGEMTADVKDKVANLSAQAATTASTIKSWWSGRFNEWKDKLANLSAQAETAASTIKSWWDSRSKYWYSKAATLSARVITAAGTIKAIWNHVSAAWKNKVATFSLKFSAAASDLKSWVNKNVIDKVNAKFKYVPILKNHLIPHLANGGYVRANTPQLALIGDNRHQGEVVAPEDKLLELARNAAAMSGGTDSAGTVELLRAILELLQTLPVVQLDAESLRKYFVAQTNRNTNRNNGVCELKI